MQPELLFEVSVAPAWKQRSPETVNPFAKDARSIRHANEISSAALDCQMVRACRRRYVTPDHVLK
jgi:hypothetical protein